MHSPPSPSRAEKALDTSPPEGGEERRELGTADTLPRPLQGERWSAQQTGEGAVRPKPIRRKAIATQRARSLRHGGNQAEALLWRELKGKQLGGYHFVRQQPIGPYFADFCCRKAKLIVEVDGSQHADSTYDRIRDEIMRRLGYSVLRFWNTDVLKQRTAVCETILAALEGRIAENTEAVDLRFVHAADPLNKSQRLNDQPKHNTDSTS